MTETNNQEIAIIGLAGKFPGADSIEEFWLNLKNGIESIHFFSDQELLNAGILKEILQQPNYVKAKAIISDPENFDAPFFNFSATEAEITDPQHRIFLQCAWHALENAGYCPDNYSDLIGVYSASSNYSTYYQQYLSQQKKLLERVGYYQMTISNLCDFLATKTAYKLGLRGPAINYQTACSSSLVAVHYACQDLLNYQTDIAIAGGVSISFPIYEGYFYQEGMILSPDGHCRAFSADAQGTVRGDGVGIVVLKRLEEAINDGDHIYAVIKGSAINNDGNSKIGYTAPSIEGQKTVIQNALAAANISASNISYIEAHGTGTPLGDPIEIQALLEVFAKTPKNRFCGLGSVKTNFGHLDAAAGIAGLLKTVLAIHHKQLPPSLNLSSATPKIDWENSPFYINTQLKNWDNDCTIRCAGVSSFGVGGTNAHVIVSESPIISKQKNSRSIHLINISAASDAAYEQQKNNLLNYLRKKPNINLANAAYTLHMGRRQFAYRGTFIIENESNSPTNEFKVVTSFKQKIYDKVQCVFLFSGQGSQYQHMGQAIYDSEAVFRQTVDDCAEIIFPYFGSDIREIIFSNVKSLTQNINQTRNTQPALFILEYALAKLLMHWGIKPDAMIGHSIGEYVAACLSGVFSLEDALKIVALRGKYMQELPSGEMLAILAKAETILPLLPKGIELSVVNSPCNCVVSGSSENIKEFEKFLNNENIPTRKVLTSHAFHSHHMDPMLDAFKKALAEIRFSKPKIPFISNLTGTWIDENQVITPDYWIKHLRHTVNFSLGISNLLEQHYTIFLEVGPGRTLTQFVNQHLDSKNNDALCVVHTLPNEKESEKTLVSLVTAVGKLWISGFNILWEKYYSPEEKHRQPLPGYPFQEQRYSVNNFVLENSSNNDSLYQYQWKLSPLVKVDNIVDPQVIIFCDNINLSNLIISTFETKQTSVIRIFAGSECKMENQNLYVIRKNHVEDYDWLFEKIFKINKQAYLIIYTWSYKPSSSFIQDPILLEDYFYNLLYLTQALGKHSNQLSIAIKIICNNMHRILEQDQVNPFQGLLTGYCKVIPAEYPNITCQCIDIEDDNHINKNEFSEILYQELIDNSPSSIFVAYRDRQRYSCELILIDRQQVAKKAWQLVKSGVYLITGGLGGIGLALAEHLAKKANIKLVLINRNKFPDRQLWRDSKNLTDDQLKKIDKILAIEASGSQVYIFQADVSDKSQMQTLVDQLQINYGKIRGVIHSAGIPGGGMIQKRDHKNINEVFSAKIYGTWIIDQLFAHQPLDFFVLCSSLTSVLGGTGQLDYCAANAFLDKYAEYKNAQNTTTQVVSINWDRWLEVGMAVDYFKQNNLDKSSTKKNLVDHPLLTQWEINNNDNYIFYAELSPLQHWVLSEHCYKNQYMLPATAYIEMIVAAFSIITGKISCQIQDIYWMKPIIMEKDQSAAIHITFNLAANTDESHFKFSISSCLADNKQFVDNAVGSIRVLPSVIQQSFKVSELVSRFALKRIQLNHKPTTRDGFIQFGEHWSSSDSISIHENETFAKFLLQQKFYTELEHYILHPALFDEAMSNWSVALNNPFLPYYCETINIFNSLSSELYSYSRCESGYKSDEKIKHVNVSIFDLHGNEFISFNNFVVKRIDI